MDTLETIRQVLNGPHSPMVTISLILQTIAVYLGTEAERRSTTRERSRSRDRGGPRRASGAPPMAQPGSASGAPPMAQLADTPVQFRGVPATPGPDFSQVPRLPRGPGVPPRGPPPGTPWVAPGTPAPRLFQDPAGLRDFSAPPRPAGPADAPPPGGYRNVFDDEAAP